MRLKSLHSKVFKRYLISNICLVIIPVFILAFLYFFYARAQIIEQFEQAQLYSLEHAVSSVDGDLADFEVLATQLSLDQEIRPYTLDASGYTTMMTLQKLRTYHIRTSFLSELFLYIRDMDILYTSEGVISFDTYANYRYRFDQGWDMDTFVDILSNTNSFRALPHEYRLHSRARNESYLLMLYPWPAHTGQSFGCVGGLVRAGYFKELLESLRGSIQSASYITDEQGNVIFASEEGLSVGEGDLETFMSERDTPIRDVRIGGRIHSMISLQSGQNGWRYVTFFPHGQFTRSFFSMHVYYLVIITLLLVMSIGMGVYLSYASYRPIYELQQLIGSTVSRDEGEINRLNHSVREILDRNQSLARQLSERQKATSHQLLTHIVRNDDIVHDDAFMARIREEGISLCGPYFCMLALYVPRKLTPEEIDSLSVAIQVLSDGSAYMLDMVYKGIAVLCNTQNRVQDMRNRARTNPETVALMFSVPPQIGVGHAYQSLDSLSLSLSEAMSALDGCGVLRKGDIVFFDDFRVADRGKPFWEKPAALLRLTQGLRQSSTLVIDDSLRELLDETVSFAAKGKSLEVRYLMDTMTQQLIVLIDEADADISHEEIDNLIRTMDTGSFFSLYTQACGKISQAYRRQQTGDRNRLFEQVMQYIHVHYTQQGMSLHLLADQFDMPPSSMSKFFRSRANKNFIDYLTELRMERACSLLRDTDLRIRDIVEQVGYADISSFTRKFTLLKGISPGKYREQCKAEGK